MGPGSVRRPTVADCPIPVVGMAEACVTLPLEALSDEGRDVQDQLLESSQVEADSASAGDPARPADSARRTQRRPARNSTELPCVMARVRLTSSVIVVE